MLCGPFNQTSFDFNSTDALRSSKHQTVGAVKLTCSFSMNCSQKMRGEGPPVTWVLLMVCVSNETPAAYSLNIVAFKQASHRSPLAGVLPAHLQIEKGAVESCFVIDFCGILAWTFPFPSLRGGSGRAPHCREDWLKGERRTHSGGGVAQFLCYP